MRERVGGSNPGKVTHAKDRRCNKAANEQSCKHPRCAKNADHRSPEEVVLLLNSQGPGGADRRRQGDVEQILNEKNVRPPGRSAKCFEYRLADEPRGIEVADE